MNRQIALAFALALGGCSQLIDAAEAVTKCSLERATVKIADDLHEIPAVQDTTIAALGQLPVPPGLGHFSNRFDGPERVTWRVHATVYAIVPETDGDYHLRLRDDNGNQLIAETPSESCAAHSPVHDALIAARRQVESLRAKTTLPLRVVISGVGFFDVPHGVIGQAPNNLELHLIVSIAEE